jgi:hypothetical protein
LCREKVDYVRNFVFNEINLDRVNPTMPYHDRARPFVNHWFSSSRGGNANSFCETLCEANQDRLEAEGGVCIMYAHFACGFSTNGTVNTRVERLLRRLAARDGWFVPVSMLLDFLREVRQTKVISAAELYSMEQRWAYEKSVLLAGRVFHPPATWDYQPPESTHVHDY